MLAKHALSHAHIAACTSPHRTPGAGTQRMRPAALKGGAGSPELPAPIKIVGCGSCGVDYLASIAAFPKPDEKLRTDRLEGERLRRLQVQGGGNAANALTAAARLGLSPVLLTKIGGDGLGDGIISELRRDGISTDYVLRAEGHPSPFTYIIVDRTGGTRTCIHTPGAALDASEVTPERLAGLLEGAALVCFDGRLTEAALVLAQAAKAAGVPVLVEGERLRPSLDQLLGLADYVVTSAHFPKEATGEAVLGDALLTLAQRLPGARLIITTLGARGSVMLERGAEQAAAPGAQALEEVIEQLTAELAPVGPGGGNGDCVSSSGVGIARGGVASTPGALSLSYSAARSSDAASSSAAAAAARAAAMNADAGNAAGYAAAAAAGPPPAGGVTARVTVAAAASLPREAVADTTGAGDSFIGSVMYGLVTGMEPRRILQLAGVVAAAKCTALGARPGLPARQQISAELLQA